MSDDTTTLGAPDLSVGGVSAGIQIVLIKLLTPLIYASWMKRIFVFSS